MRQILLATALIAVPVALFSAFEVAFAPAQAAPAAVADAGPSLGDMSAFTKIISDVEGIAKTGDFAAAQTRITDFETAWDDAQQTLQPINRAAWGHIDDAADAALHALRASAPDAATVTSTLASLADVLDNPSGTGLAAGSVVQVSGIAVTDDTGHAIPCEDLITQLKAAIDAGKIPAANQAAATDFKTKALERCNADDDTRADAFSAQGLALASN